MATVKTALAAATTALLIIAACGGGANKAHQSGISKIEAAIGNGSGAEPGVTEKAGVPEPDTTLDAARTEADSFFIDTRDGNTYRTVTTGNLTWMAENLNYKADSSWCYNNADSNCVKYGRLYNWNAASTACPSGWRLPYVGDWDNLAQAVGGQRKKEEDGDSVWRLPRVVDRGNMPDDEVRNDLIRFIGGPRKIERYYWAVAGKKLKSRTGWDDNGGGTNDFGFSAMPGGDRGSDGYFYYVGLYGAWWSARESSYSSAYRQSMQYNNENMSEANYSKGYGFSVRCIRMD